MQYPAPEWIHGIGDGDCLGDTWWNKVGRLDFKASYRFNTQAEVFLEANNLLREPGWVVRVRVRPPQREALSRCR